MDPAARALHAHRLLMRLAFGMVSVFVWIFLFEFFVTFASTPARAMVGVTIVYALSQAIALLLTPLAAGHLRRGVRPSMIAGVLLLSSALVVLGAVLSGAFAAQVLWGTLLFALLYGAYRALYWTPYRIQESLSGEPVRLWIEILIALIPAVAGVAIMAVPLGPVRVLFGAAALLLISLIPIFSLPDMYESYSWHYFQSFRELFRAQHRGILLHGIFDGMQGAALFLVWPLAVFLIVHTSYVTLGVVMSLTLLIFFFLQKPLQRLMRVSGLQDSNAVRVTLAVSGWVFRLAAGSPLGIIFADSYSYLGAPRGRSIEVLSFDQVADSSTYIDEFSALKEIALAIGRMALCICFAVLVIILPLPLALASTLTLAAISSGVVVMLSHKMSLSV